MTILPCQSCKKFYFLKISIFSNISTLAILYPILNFDFSKFHPMFIVTEITLSFFLSLTSDCGKKHSICKITKLQRANSLCRVCPAHSLCLFRRKEVFKMSYACKCEIILRAFSRQLQQNRKLEHVKVILIIWIFTEILVTIWILKIESSLSSFFLLFSKNKYV